MAGQKHCSWPNTHDANMSAHDLSERRYWRNTFREVYNRFAETKTQSTTMSVEGFYAGLAREGGRAALNPNFVGPSPSDFVCDFEITARRVLSEREHKYFLDTHVNCLERRSDKNLNRSIGEKMGHALIERGIYPLTSYFKPKFIDRPR
jgi:hypothetical protein